MSKTQPVTKEFLEEMHGTEWFRTLQAISFRQIKSFESKTKIRTAVEEGETEVFDDLFWKFMEPDLSEKIFTEVRGTPEFSNFLRFDGGYCNEMRTINLDPDDVYNLFVGNDTENVRQWLHESAADYLKEQIETWFNFTHEAEPFEDPEDEDSEDSEDDE